MISGRVSGKSLLAPQPACKVHGAAVMAVQNAMTVCLSPVTRGDLKPPNQPGLNVLERRASGWPFISYRSR